MTHNFLRWRAHRQNLAPFHFLDWDADQLVFAFGASHLWRTCRCRVEPGFSFFQLRSHFWRGGDAVIPCWLVLSPGLANYAQAGDNGHYDADSMICFHKLLSFVFCSRPGLLTFLNKLVTS